MKTADMIIFDVLKIDGVEITRIDDEEVIKTK